FTILALKEIHPAPDKDSSRPFEVHEPRGQVFPRNWRIIRSKKLSDAIGDKGKAIVLFQIEQFLVRRQRLSLDLQELPSLKFFSRKSKAHPKDFLSTALPVQEGLSPLCVQCVGKVKGSIVVKAQQGGQDPVLLPHDGHA